MTEDDMSDGDDVVRDSQAPGQSMEALIGMFDAASETPADLSERHDHYLAQALLYEPDRERPAKDA